MTDTPITSGTKDYLDQAVRVLASAFLYDPVFRFFTCSLSREQHEEYLATYLRAIVKAGLVNDGIINEINDWSSCAVWLPPGKRIDGVFTIIQSGLVQSISKLGIGGAKRMIMDYTAQVDKAKKKHLKDPKKYYYCLILGTRPENQGQGLATQLISKQQLKTTEENLPIWLEATTAKSRDLYARCGFQTLDPILLGKGTNDETGERKQGGAGVTIWPMIWYPDSQ